jgi:hypothetical protein
MKILLIENFVAIGQETRKMHSTQHRKLTDAEI